MTQELLQLKNIYKNFGNVKVLKDVNININKGEVVALIGDNGAGKSTLIKNHHWRSSTNNWPNKF